MGEADLDETAFFSIPSYTLRKSVLCQDERARNIPSNFERHFVHFGVEASLAYRNDIILF